ISIEAGLLLVFCIFRSIALLNRRNKTLDFSAISHEFLTVLRKQQWICYTIAEKLVLEGDRPWPPFQFQQLSSVHLAENVPGTCSRVCSRNEWCCLARQSTATLPHRLLLSSCFCNIAIQSAIFGFTLTVLVEACVMA